MTTNSHSADILEQAVGSRREDRNRPAVPGRDVNRTIRPDCYTVWIALSRKTLNDSTGGKVNDGERVAKVFRRVQIATIRRDSDPRWILDAVLVLFSRREDDAVSKSRCTAGPVEPVDDVLVSTGH